VAAFSLRYLGETSINFMTAKLLKKAGVEPFY
jgi:hypothetical protein